MLHEWLLEQLAVQEKSRGSLVEALRSCTLILEQTAALWNRADEGEGEILRGLDAAAETAEAHRWGDSNCGGGQAVAGASPLSQWFSGRSRESLLRRDWLVCPDVCAAVRGRRAPCLLRSVLFKRLSGLAELGAAART